MEKSTAYRDHLLQIELTEGAHELTLVWTGKSVNRKPSDFITPILLEVIKKSTAENKPVVLDFRHLEYMNSSTITPIIKILERARKGAVQMRLLYRKSLKWQELSFSALQIFATKDGRVEIKGDDSHAP
jgi:anti-anti-sigma regulatory factor